jgi:energy-coupling factor transport system ATP-binding protein
VIHFDQVGFTYDGSARPVLRGVSLRIEEGELCLVIGHTGSGKSTLLAAVNGLVPHFTGGTLTGRVVVDGRDTARYKPRELADVVGVVGQDPLAGFVTDTVEEELAYTMEQLAISPAAMRTRMEETLDLLGLADLRHRALHSLSGGQQQRVAIGSALTAHPRVLVLDEPTSALDPTSAEDVLAAITRLVHDLGVTVVLAEHRLERVVPYADRVVYLAGAGRDGPTGRDGRAGQGGRTGEGGRTGVDGWAGRVEVGAPADILSRAEVRPPIVELGRLAGWEPLPLSVRDARRLAPRLRRQLPDTPPIPARPAHPAHPGHPGHPALPALPASSARPPRPARIAGGGQPALTARGIVVRYGPVIAVRAVGLTLRGGECTALMGRNGSGKSSLLWALQGTGGRAAGTVSVGAAAADPARLRPALARRLVGLVPQTPADLLYLDTVEAELAQADRDVSDGPMSDEPNSDGPNSDGPNSDGPNSDGHSPVPARDILDEIAPGIPAEAHPRDLSAGQQLALVLAIQLTAAPSVILLDEPTRGLDYQAKASLTGVLDQLAARGHAVVVATHDVEFVTRACDRVVVMADGEIVTDGPAAAVLTASPTFAPQIAKILAPLPYLTEAQVAAGLGRRTGS